MKLVQFPFIPQCLTHRWHFTPNYHRQETKE